MIASCKYFLLYLLKFVYQLLYVKLEKYHLKNDEVNTKNGKIKTYFINWYDETTEKKFYEIMKKEIIYPEISLKYFNTENRLNKILHPEKEEKK